jgi:hypothetical protein
MPFGLKNAPATLVLKGDSFLLLLFIIMCMYDIFYYSLSCACLSRVASLVLNGDSFLFFTIHYHVHVCHGFII